MKFAIAFAALTVSVAAPAIAAPPENIVYLECRLGGQPWKIALDENNKTVTWERGDMVSTIPAVFLPDRVAWGDGMMAISRIDLTFTRTYPNNIGVDRGTCRIVERGERAF